MQDVFVYIAIVGFGLGLLTIGYCTAKLIFVSIKNGYERKDWVTLILGICVLLIFFGSLGVILSGI